MLAQHPDDAEVWMPVYNGYVETYGLVDEVYEEDYLHWSNDFFGTPGRMDKRLFENHRGENRDDERILCISSDFGRIPNKDVDCGSDDINYPIKTLNGEDGDPDLVWHINNFEETKAGVYVRTWVDEEHNAGIVTYDTERDWLEVFNDKNRLEFKGKLTGIEDIRKALEVCKVPFTLFA